MSQFKISTRLAGLLTALCLLVLLVGGGGLFGMGQSNAGLKSVYDDRVVPQSAAARYAEALPNARLEIVKASGHCVDMEQPEALARLVTNFIGRE